MCTYKVGKIRGYLNKYKYFSKNETFCGFNGDILGRVYFQKILSISHFKNICSFKIVNKYMDDPRIEQL